MTAVTMGTNWNTKDRNVLERELKKKFKVVTRAENPDKFVKAGGLWRRVEVRDILALNFCSPLKLCQTLFYLD